MNAAGYSTIVPPHLGTVSSSTHASHTSDMPVFRTGMSGAVGGTATSVHTGEGSDCVIPSMTALRSSADVQERVNARPQALEWAAATSVQCNCQNTSVHGHGGC